MNLSAEKEILEKIYFVRKKNLIREWPSNLMNARLVLKNVGLFDSVFDMLKSIVFFDEFCLYRKPPPGLNEYGSPKNPEGFSDFDLEIFPFYQINLNINEYYCILSISNFTYYEFIASAILFIIENSLNKQKNMDFVSYFIATNIVNLVMRGDNFSIQISFLLKEICIEKLFSKTLFICIYFSFKY